VALAVGLTVATLGLGSTARAQVSSTFDAHTSRDVTLNWQPGDLGALSARERAELPARLASINGVDAAGIVADHGETVVRAGPVRAGRVATAYAMSGDVPRAGRLAITWRDPGGRMTSGSVLVGEALAKTLDLAPLSAKPVVMVGGYEFEVAGLLRTSSRVDRLPSSVMLLDADARVLGVVRQESALLLTALGAAQQIARQAPVVVNPYAPETLRAQAPPDPRTLRNQVEGDLQVTMYVLSVVALLAACVGLANAMVLAVLERRQEFGLRRAVGARPIHVFSLVITESALIGAVGGLLGLLAGLLGLLGVTILNQWAPVIVPALVPGALIGGIGVGAVSGVVAALRAARIEPGEALRN
jgi:macrolide transport system ATP-binding/permease protein